MLEKNKKLFKKLLDFNNNIELKEIIYCENELVVGRILSVFEFDDFLIS